MRYLSADEASRSLMTLLDTVHRGPVIIRRSGQDVAALVSVQEYEKLTALNVAEFNRFCDRIGNLAAARGLAEVKLASDLKTMED